MKCIQNVETKEIKRVTNEEGDASVRSGKWKFIPRSEWKKVRPAK